MVDQEILLPCSGCGRTLPREEMFGVEPDLLCPNCRDAVSKRMNVRFRPHERSFPPRVTQVCLGISVLLFLCTHVFFPERADRAQPAWLLALYQGEPIWAGEVWRHLTCIFLHGDWFHILMNGYALWFLGRYTEMGWGHWVTAGLILGTGVSAAAVSWTMTTPGSVGISGALFGLVGFLWAQRKVHPIAAAVMHDGMIRWILTMLVLGIILSASGRYPVDNWAHGVGLGMGLLAGWAFQQRLRAVYLLGCVLLGAAFVVTSVFVAIGKPVPMVTYNQYGEVVEQFEKPRAEYRTWWLDEQAKK